jgi:hypothetical protein
MQERIHFLGFIAEREYREAEIGNRAYYRPNPHLFPNEHEQLATYKTHPLAKE